MAVNYIPLDKEKHKDLKVNVKAGLAHTSDSHLAAATLREFGQLSSSMPIVLIQDPNSSNFYCVTMLGLEQNSNLFLQDDKWQSHVMPLNMQRYPFDVRPDGEKLGVFIDENSSLLGEEGEPLFTEDGEPSDFLKNRQQLLGELANSEMTTQKFVKQLVELDLIEPMAALVTYADGQQRNITGLHIVSEKRLGELADDKVLELHKAGFLGAIYSMLISLGQLNRLVQLTTNTDKPIRGIQLRPEQAQQEQAKTASE